LHVIDRRLQRLNLAARRAHSDIACANQLFVGRLSLLELLAVFIELAFNRLESKRKLARYLTIARAKVCGCAGAQVALIGFQLAYLSHQPLAHACVRSEAGVVLPDLPAKVFFLDFQQGFGVLPLQAGDEEREETAKQIRDASEHAMPP